MNRKAVFCHDGQASAPVRLLFRDRTSCPGSHARAVSSSRFMVFDVLLTQAGSPVSGLNSAKENRRTLLPQMTGFCACQTGSSAFPWLVRFLAANLTVQRALRDA
jgi:hypothetical protein